MRFGCQAASRDLVSFRILRYLEISPETVGSRDVFEMGRACRACLLADGLLLLSLWAGAGPRGQSAHGGQFMAKYETGREEEQAPLQACIASLLMEETCFRPLVIFMVLLLLILLLLCCWEAGCGLPVACFCESEQPSGKTAFVLVVGRCFNAVAAAVVGEGRPCQSKSS